MLHWPPCLALLQFEPVTGDMEGERKRALEMVDKMLSKQPVLDVTKVHAMLGGWGVWRGMEGMN